jgi:tetratricopeptide (TPR) repeat protein
MEPIPELEQRLARYDPARYPIQHATTRFHLGVVLADAGRVEEAVESLETAAELFDPEALPVEHAKALNALGAALRLAGDVEAASASFDRAAELFEHSGLEPLSSIWASSGGNKTRSPPPTAFAALGCCSPVKPRPPPCANSAPRCSRSESLTMRK